MRKIREIILTNDKGRPALWTVDTISDGPFKGFFTLLFDFDGNRAQTVLCPERSPPYPEGETLSLVSVGSYLVEGTVNDESLTSIYKVIGIKTVPCNDPKCDYCGGRGEDFVGVCEPVFEERILKEVRR